MRPNEKRAYDEKRARNIAAVEAHKVNMTRIAERGGLSYDQMQGLSYKAKDTFIARYRDGGSEDRS